MSPLAEMATIFLASKDRDAVLGDLAETGASGWSALGSVLGLVVLVGADNLPIVQTFIETFDKVDIQCPAPCTEVPQ